MAESEERQLSKKELYELKKKQKKEVQQHLSGAGKTNAKVWYLIIAVVVALVGYAVWSVVVSSKGEDLFAQQEPNSIYDVDHVNGEATASAVLIEYSDFQCPACKAYQPTVKQLLDEFDGNLKLVYRHFPLISIHPNALPGSRAAEAAANQGKFWEMHDQLFEHQEEWAQQRDPLAFFSQYAQAIGMNVDQFKEDFKAKEVLARVNRDRGFASRLGLNSTPSFILNGEKLTSEQTGSYETFKQAIEAVINDATSSAAVTN